MKNNLPTIDLQSLSTVTGGVMPPIGPIKPPWFPKVADWVRSKLPGGSAAPSEGGGGVGPK